MPKSQRRWNALIGNVLFVALSILYVIPNALIATFLSDLSRIAEASPYMLLSSALAVDTNINGSCGTDSNTISTPMGRLMHLCMYRLIPRCMLRAFADICVDRQGFLAPVVTSIVYLLLPIVMRRLSKWQG